MNDIHSNCFLICFILEFDGFFENCINVHDVQGVVRCANIHCNNVLGVTRMHSSGKLLATLFNIREKFFNPIDFHEDGNYPGLNAITVMSGDIIEDRNLITVHTEPVENPIGNNPKNNENESEINVDSIENNINSITTTANSKGKKQPMNIQHIVDAIESVVNGYDNFENPFSSIFINNDSLDIEDEDTVLFRCFTPSYHEEIRNHIKAKNKEQKQIAA